MLLQVGILMHFVNAFAAAYLVNRLFQIQGIPPTFINSLALLLTALGLGAVVELMEYGVMLTIEDNGVGNYDNNMQDLLSNFCGSLTFLMVRLAARRIHPD